MVASSNEASLVASIMFDIIDQVAWDLGVSVRGWCIWAKVSQGVVLIDLPNLECFGILPLSVAIFLINEDGLLVVAWNLNSVLYQSKLVDCQLMR